MQHFENFPTEANVKDTHSSAGSSDSEDEEYIEGHDDEDSEDEDMEERRSTASLPNTLTPLENGISQDSIPEENRQTPEPTRKTSDLVLEKNRQTPELVRKTSDLFLQENRQTPELVRKSLDLVPEEDRQTSELTRESLDLVPEEDRQTPELVRKISDIPKGSSLDQIDMATKKMIASKSFDSLSTFQGNENKMDAKSKGDVRQKIRKQSAFNYDVPNRKTSKEHRKFSTESDPGVTTEYQRTQPSRLHRRGAVKATRVNKSEAVPSTSPSQDKWASRRYVTHATFN